MARLTIILGLAVVVTGGLVLCHVAWANKKKRSNGLKVNQKEEEKEKEEEKREEPLHTFTTSTPSPLAKSSRVNLKREEESNINPTSQEQMRQEEEEDEVDATSLCSSGDLVSDEEFDASMLSSLARQPSYERSQSQILPEDQSSLVPNNSEVWVDEGEEMNELATTAGTTALKSDLTFTKVFDVAPPFQKVEQETLQHLSTKTTKKSPTPDSGSSDDESEDPVTTLERGPEEEDANEEYTYLTESSFESKVGEYSPALDKIPEDSAKLDFSSEQRDQKRLATPRDRVDFSGISMQQWSDVMDQEMAQREKDIDKDLLTFDTTKADDDQDQGQEAAAEFVAQVSYETKVKPTTTTERNDSHL